MCSISDLKQTTQTIPASCKLDCLENCDHHVFPPLNLALNIISTATTRSVIFIFQTLHAIFFSQIVIDRSPSIRLNCNCINRLTVFKPLYVNLCNEEALFF